MTIPPKATLLRHILPALLMVGWLFPCFVYAWPSERIINGTPSLSGNWPWMSALFSAADDEELTRDAFFCGGVLIDPSYILTAGHCAAAFTTRPGQLSVVVGGSQLISKEGIRRGVTGVILHPGFDRETLRFDAALLKLSDPIPIEPVVPVADSDIAYWTPGNATGVIVGWGSTDTSRHAASDILQQASIPIISDLNCAANLGADFFPLAMICGGVLSDPGTANGTDSCSGDSGGPLVVSTPAGHRLVGLTSWGRACASDLYFGAYTRISAVRDFALSKPLVPPVPIGFPTITGTPSFAETLTCINNRWIGEELRYSYRWIDVASGATSSDSATFRITADHVGRSFACKVTASNSSGTRTSTSSARGPIAPDGTVPTDAPEEETPIPITLAAHIESASVHCRARRCRIVTRTAIGEDTEISASVHGTSRFIGRSCSAGMAPSRCPRIRIDRKLALRWRGGFSWYTDLQSRGPGSYRVLLFARGIQGSRQPRPTTLRFRVR